MDTNQRKRKITLLILLALGIVAIIAIVAIWQHQQRKGKFPVEILKAPHDTKIYYEGKEVRSSTLYLPEGKHTVKGELSGFESYDAQIDIKSSEDREYKLFFVLTPRTSEAREYVTNNNDEYLDIERESEEYFSKEGESIQKKYPIIDHLPYRGSFYNIEYYWNGEEFRIQIKSPDAMGRQVAIERIKSWGYDPTDFKVEFLGFNNPFTPGDESE